MTISLLLMVFQIIEASALSLSSLPPGARSPIIADQVVDEQELADGSGNLHSLHIRSGRAIHTQDDGQGHFLIFAVTQDSGTMTILRTGKQPAAESGSSGAVPVYPVPETNIDDSGRLVYVAEVGNGQELPTANGHSASVRMKLPWDIHTEKDGAGGYYIFVLSQDISFWREFSPYMTFDTPQEEYLNVLHMSEDYRITLVTSLLQHQVLTDDKGVRHEIDLSIPSGIFVTPAPKGGYRIFIPSRNPSGLLVLYLDNHNQLQFVAQLKDGDTLTDMSGNNKRFWFQPDTLMKPEVITDPEGHATVILAARKSNNLNVLHLSADDRLRIIAEAKHQQIMQDQQGINRTVKLHGPGSVTARKTESGDIIIFVGNCVADNLTAFKLKENVLSYVVSLSGNDVLNVHSNSRLSGCLTSLYSHIDDRGIIQLYAGIFYVRTALSFIEFDGDTLRPLGVVQENQSLTDELTGDPLQLKLGGVVQVDAQQDGDDTRLFAITLMDHSIVMLNKRALQSIFQQSPPLPEPATEPVAVPTEETPETLPARELTTESATTAATSLPSTQPSAAPVTPTQGKKNKNNERQGEATKKAVAKEMKPLFCKVLPLACPPLGWLFPSFIKEQNDYVLRINR